MVDLAFPRYKVCSAYTRNELELLFAEKWRRAYCTDATIAFVDDASILVKDFDSHRQHISITVTISPIPATLSATVIQSWP